MDRVPSSDLVVTPVSPADFAPLVALMAREGCPCHCRFWHFTGTSKEWEARCALEPERNRDELGAAIASGSDEGRGLVARVASAPERIVGWMKLAPRRALPKLLARVPYRGLDAPERPAAEVLSIACFLVDPALRRHGVARALVEGAIEWAPRWGAVALEAYPRRSDAPLHDGEAWMGPSALFDGLGVVVGREAPQYPVLRRARV
ncbi:MAG: hypothetical protein NVSMB47_12710 [Polyangiales bacterium]